MKKILFILAFVGAATFASAQNETPVSKYSVATNDFWSNWFVTVGGDATYFIGSQEKGMGLTQNPFHKFRNTLGFGVGVGKWFTPGIGARVKFQGINGKGVVSDNNAINKANMKNYWAMNGQVMFNLSNLVYGYNENRVWNLIVYPGVGLMRNMTKNIYAVDAQIGVMNTFKISKRVDIFADLNMIAAERKIDGVEERSSSQRYSFQNYDKLFTAEIGIKFNLGKTNWEKTPDVDAINALNAEQLASLNATLKAAQDENARLKAQLAKANTDAATIKKLQDELTDCRKKPATAPVETVNTIHSLETNVFFAVGKSVITAAQQPNVERVATFLKNHPEANVVIKGYASPEGSSDINNKLGVARAEAVKSMLINKYKIAASRIKAEGCGVGDLFSEPTWNRVAVSTIMQ